MTEPNIEIRKKRGRPRAGQTPVVSLRLHQESQQEIDEWRSQEPGHSSRSEAVRMLLAMALCAADDEDAAPWVRPIPVRPLRQRLLLVTAGDRHDVPVASQFALG